MFFFMHLQVSTIIYVKNTNVNLRLFTSPYRVCPQMEIIFSGCFECLGSVFLLLEGVILLCAGISHYLLDLVLNKSGIETSNSRDSVVVHTEILNTL